ncbi:Ig-like domain-containing protein [Pyxidicoccus sp. 3LFB2]
MHPRIQRCLASFALLSLCVTGSACGNDDESPKPENRPPTLTGPTVQAAQVGAGEAVALTLDAADADGDTLTYAWLQTPASPAGTFSSTTAQSPTWTAPTVDGEQRFTLGVTVTDGKGGSVQGQVAVDVLPPVDPGNTAPTLTQRPSASPSTVGRQQATTLAVAAADVDGDTLTYTWEQTAPASPVGTFSSTSVAGPTWTAPDVDSGTFTLRVTVSDGKGGSVRDTVDVSVQGQNRAPTVAATITAPGTLLAGATGAFSITASDADGDTLTYAWTQQAPATQGTWVGATTGNSAQWYSPAVGTQTSFTLSVSVTDGKSAPVVRTVTVPVTVPRYATDIQTVWSTANCTGCHPTSGGLNLSAASSYSNLVNVTARVAACNTLSRVKPSAPDDSVLVRKLEGTACGTRMPRNNTTYFDQNPGLLVRVRSWILAGALND